MTTKGTPAPAGARLKRIATQRLRLGMYIHALDGDWLQHGFWKSRFLLDQARMLQRLQASAVQTCWIDLDRGLDEAPDADAGPADEPIGGVKPAPSGDTIAAAGPALPAPPSPAVLPAGPLQPTIGARAVPAPTHALADELNQASDICRRSREVVASLINDARLGRALEVNHCQPLVEEITDSVMRNPAALVSLARLKTADDYSYMHSVAVCALMVALARQLGLDEATTRAAGLAGLLHDLGKATVPLAVLNKPGQLDPEEWALIRAHPVRGHQLLLESVGGSAEPDSPLAAALDVCLRHHERMDGRGYPDGLQGDQLSLLARMGAVCDVYDAITSNRPYKAGWDPAESIARMARWEGHFDPLLFQHFVRSLGIYPVGALVRLASGRLAVVVDQNPAQLTRPKLRVFHDAVRDRPLPPCLIDLAVDDGERIVDREPARRGQFPQLDALWADHHGTKA